jgi:predicted nuclease with TOPRIM domain
LKSTQAGQIGALLRREGLYSLWRRQKKQGLLKALSPKKRGRKIQPKNPLADQMARLEKENQKLREKLKKAETIIEVQKKFRTFWESHRIPATKRIDRNC